MGSHSKLYWSFKQGGVSDINTNTKYKDICLLWSSLQVVAFKWLYIFYSLSSNGSMSPRLCGCYMILLFMCNDFKAFYILLLLQGLAWHYTIFFWYFLHSVSTDVLLNVWLSDNTLSFHFTCQHICLSHKRWTFCGILFSHLLFLLQAFSQKQ